MSSQLDEVVHALGALRAELEDIAVGGLRTFAPERVPALRSHIEELERVGAGYLADKLHDLVSTIEANERASAPSLMRAQASLRLFERMLTLRVAQSRLADLADDDTSAAVEEA